MYLKEIKAHGFKSFADQISIQLNKEITGIVGPNGSGKSNVVDAVRWVLGEQSVKSLRGDGNMTDVIFSGSKSRGKQNSATVTIIIDNNDSYLQIPFSEISIKRRVYSDGTNEYYLNGEKCRLKDITNLLLDSGIAKESFNIISQGQVEEIFTSKPQERRVIFEEAAGVLKYKKRKEEAIRKLDRTHDNMNRVNDIIAELEVQVEPLKIQKEQTLEYLSYKEDLESIELALITSDITNINFKYQTNKAKIEVINNELLSLSTDSSGNEAKIEEYKLNISKLSTEISFKQKELIEITTQVEKINSQKAIILERKKYEVDDSKLHTNLVELKESELTVERELNSLKLALEAINNDLSIIEIDLQKQEKEIEAIKTIEADLDRNLSNEYRVESLLKNRIENLRESIDNNSSLPQSVRAILDNPKLSGVHNALGNLIAISEEYATAISVALGVASTNVVVDNENNAKDAISYLKNNNIGRVTFYPLNIIKPKGVESDILLMLQKSNGFINIASELVKYDKKYHNIVSNQLGNIIIVDNLDNANVISKKINYRYRIVTLEGEVLHVGGSLTGGNLLKSRTVISEKYELEKAIKELELVGEKIKKIETDISTNDNTLRALEDKLYLINKDRATILNDFENKNNNIKLVSEKLDSIKLEIKGTKNIVNETLSKEEEKIITEHHNAVKNRDSIESEISRLTKEKDRLSNELEEFEFTHKKENNLFNTKNSELKDLEIEVNRMDVKLDNLLSTLNEQYNMTYEKAASIYKLEIEESEARGRVSNLKNKIKNIGMVNLAAPDEYDRVSVRYEFLIKQRDDLINAENTLLEIIQEMDQVMIAEFEKTFKVIKENFTKTFKELFKGGNAELKLTDPNNILETGIEIVASPPGKKLSSISLLSGGEKTLTAISLLFAILKSRDVPFCILDEVEAALDEVNVDAFGEYLHTLKPKTQFVLITHKKKTMEYADILYGITMQESGVSKLVSVKLADIK